MQLIMIIYKPGSVHGVAEPGSHCGHVFYWPLRKFKLLTRNFPDVEGIGNHEKTTRAQRTFVPPTVESVELEKATWTGGSLHTHLPLSTNDVYIPSWCWSISIFTAGLMS